MWRRLFRIRIPAGQLGDLLFERVVLEDEISFREKHLAPHIESVAAQTGVFGRQVFVYLAASVAVALTNGATRQSVVFEVIVRFRQRVTSEALRRWGVTREDTDCALEAAASHLARLLFTPPRSEPGTSFDWAREWLAATGIEETNPASLFLVSSFWNYEYLYLAKTLRKFRIVH